MVFSLRRLKRAGTDRSRRDEGRAKAARLSSSTLRPAACPWASNEASGFSWFLSNSRDRADVPGRHYATGHAPNIHPLLHWCRLVRPTRSPFYHWEPFVSISAIRGQKNSNNSWAKIYTHFFPRKTRQPSTHSLNSLIHSS